MAESTQDSPNPPTKRKGRPRLDEEKEIIATLRPYYENNFRDSTTADLTKINRRTVAKYFRQWNQDLMDEQNKNFIEAQEIARQRSLQRFDRLKARAEGFLREMEIKIKDANDKVESKRAEGKEAYYTVNFFLENKRLDWMRYLTELEDLIAKVTMAPTTEQLIEGHIQQMMEKQKKMIEIEN